MIMLMLANQKKKEDFYVHDINKTDTNKQDVYTHNVNKKDDVYVRDSNNNNLHSNDNNLHSNDHNLIRNDNNLNRNDNNLNKDVYVNDGNKKTDFVDTTKRNDVNVVHEDFDKRNLNYDTNQSFANDIGTTGLVGNNLGNNLATNVPAPTGINKNADWAGHVPDLNHPTEAEAKDLKKKNEKKW